MSNSIPTDDTLKKCFAVNVLNAEGEKIEFGKLLEEGAEERRKTVVVFVRHFFCGSCQDYVSVLATVRPEALAEANTKIIIVGCGDFQPIKFYSETTSFPVSQIYANPTRELFTFLNTTNTTKGAPAGQTPSYMTVGLPMNILRSMFRAVLNIGVASKGGPPSQNGGELVFDHEKRCTFANIMQHSQDHKEVADLMKEAGVAFP